MTAAQARSDRCVCCGGAAPGIANAWFSDWRTLVDCGRSISLSRQQALIFDALWKMRGRSPVSTDHLIHLFYGSDPNGGPDRPSRVIEKVMCDLRAKLAGTALCIPIERKGGAGYRLAHAGEAAR